VGELLRTYVEDVLGIRPDHPAETADAPAVIGEAAPASPGATKG
jgi:hypothetical protein